MTRLGRCFAVTACLFALAGCASAEPVAGSAQGTPPAIGAVPTLVHENRLCPLGLQDSLNADADSDGVAELVFLRNDGSTNLIGICDPMFLVTEVEIGGMAPTLSGIFDIDGDGLAEIFAADTSARSVLFVAATQAGAMLEMTDLLLEYTIDMESGAPFQARGFRCGTYEGRTRLMSTIYEPIGDEERVTVNLVDLNGLKTTETTIDSYDVDPSAALADWREAATCFEG